MPAPFFSLYLRSMKRLITFALLLVSLCGTARERERFDTGWEFAFGNASSPALDFGCGTEYFNYLTKAASIHNAGPYSPDFDKSKWDAEWKEVTLPHDWVVDLPFERNASHSHGYKTVGYAYPETSVGWYRKTFTVPASDDGRHISLRFDGIFRSADIWVNGFWLGHEPSGYTTQVYDISEYLSYGGENLVAVRVDATLEEGWFYEGAGIYRHVWLEKTAPLHVAPFGTFVHASLSDDFGKAQITVETTVRNDGTEPAEYSLRQTLLDADGACIASVSVPSAILQAKAESNSTASLNIDRPRLWSPGDPYLYTVRTQVLLPDGTIADTYENPTGIRSAVFDPDNGLLLNGKRLEIRGVNQHQDHPGVGSAIPDAVQVYRLRQLKALGVNAIRTSHNPAAPELLDACDSLGLLVLEENRLTGINDEHLRLLRRMTERDRNHPSIILWSVGNEEWGIEWSDKGRRIAQSMCEFCHRLDPTRPVSVATSSGPNIIEGVDVAGYNYLIQNDIDGLRKKFPRRPALGSEETSGCGTRGVYFEDPDGSRMPSLNRRSDTRDSCLNVIGRGLRFYRERPWLAGLFYWTGFDYRGEPNPLEFPVTGSQFGILDYCGFPKDEAWYLKAWWTDEPVLHVFPHWNLHGHEGENVSIWVYSNCDEVELTVNGKRLGRKRMEPLGYLSWDAVYKPGRITASGFRNGKKILTRTIETTGAPAFVNVTADRTAIKADGQDVAVCTLSVVDLRGQVVPDACSELTITVEGPVRILGCGNGDPAYREPERPAEPGARTFSLHAFNGLAQVLLQSGTGSGTATLTVSGEGLSGKLELASY